MKAAADTGITGLDRARAILGEAVLGPAQIEAALGVDVRGALETTAAEGLARVPFGTEELEAAARGGEMLVLRLPADSRGPLTIMRLAELVPGSVAEKPRHGVGYLLRPEWKLDAQPFATEEVCAPGWWLVRRTPLPDTRNRSYGAQDEVLARWGGRLRRRRAVEAVYDCVLWWRVRGERLLADAWDWSATRSPDHGFVTVGQFNEEGLHVLAYSRAVRFANLGVCTQRCGSGAGP